MEGDNSPQWAWQGKPVPVNILFVALTQRSLYTHCCRWNLHLPLPLVRHQLAMGSPAQVFDAQNSAWQHWKFFPEPFQGEFSFSNLIYIILTILRFWKALQTHSFNILQSLSQSKALQGNVPEATDWGTRWELLPGSTCRTAEQEPWEMPHLGLYLPEFRITDWFMVPHNAQQ